MERKNLTSVSEFVLLGITSQSHLQIPLFVLFLLIYSMTLLWNTVIFLTIWLSTSLHTPMYFFISSLAFLDICFSSAATPKMLADFLTKRKVISFLGCAFQVYFFCALGSTVNFLFAVMALDRYVAICNPLLYPSLMNSRACVLLVTSAYAAGFLHSLIETCITFRLSFCATNTIQHFVCDIPPLLKLSCTDTTINTLVLSIFGAINFMFSLLVILISYGYIIATVLRINSTSGRKKAFSTCASHLTAVTLAYSTVSYVYIWPSTSIDQKSVATVFYTMVIPMLNPIIYSLRNKDIKTALSNIVYQKLFPRIQQTIEIGDLKGKQQDAGTGPDHVPDTSESMDASQLPSCIPPTNVNKATDKLDLILQEVQDSRKVIEHQIGALTTGLSLLQVDHAQLTDNVKDYTIALDELLLS
ncbi:olfactory receptor 5F1-like [Lissotriton helveticus]